MNFSLPEFALKRPVTVVMISLSFLGLGFIAWNRMPLNFLPKVDRPFIGVFIAYPGASPAQVEQQIAIPVEGELRTIPGLRRIRTTSTTSGCDVGLLFNLDMDMTVATAEVRDRLERLKLVLPEEADKMLIQRFSSGSIPVMAFGMFKGGDQEQFAHLMRTVAEPRFSRLEGVAKVEILSPVQPKEVLIEFSQDTLRGLNLNLAQVIQSLRESSINLSVGNLVDGDRKYYARLMGEYRRIEDIADMVVTPGGLRLRDVATVNYRAREEEQYVALDGAGGVVVLIIKESEANTVSTCKNVHEELKKFLEEPAFKGTEHHVFFDQSDLINRALNNLFAQGFYGAVMAIGVLFFFLHKLLPTVIVSFSIPSSLMVAIVFMFFTGMSLNIVTMVSMIVAVGMLVDNAIVVTENIIRHRQLGMPMRQAVVQGASEVGLAIVASTATTAVVFVPMYFMEVGRMSVFMQQLGGPLIVSLTGSLVVALTLIPLVMSRMKVSDSHNMFQAMADGWFSRDAGAGSDPGGSGRRRLPIMRGVVAFLGALHPVQWIISMYSTSLRFALRQRLLFLVILGGCLWVTYAYPWQHVGMREMPKLDTREVRIDIELDQNFDLAMARGLFTDLEAEINKYREDLAIKKILTLHGATSGFIEVYLYTEDDGPIGENPPYRTEEVMQILSQKIPQRTPGAELTFSMADAGKSESGADVSLLLRGDEDNVLAQYAERLKKVLSVRKNFSDVNTDVERSKQEMQIKIDPSLAQQAGVSAMAVAQTVDAALRGARMPYMKQGRREIPVWAQFREEDRKSQANLDNVMVPGITGRLVPLQELTSYDKARSASAIRRVNGKNLVTVTAKTNTKNLTEVKAELRAAVDYLELPTGYSADFGDELEDLEDSIFNFTTSLAMATILVYIVMAALFESLLLPMSIMTTVPISLAGAVWALWYMGNQFDQITLIGCILMVGVIVNNGIVIVDYINQIYRTTGDRTGAVVRAGVDRFRPVMMTALTTILGLVPLAMAKTGGASTFAGLGQALVGGLTVGTVLTLFIVPIFFTFFDDLHIWSRNFFGNLLGRRIIPASAAAEPPPPDEAAPEQT